jgi:hypothetical protein
VYPSEGYNVFRHRNGGGALFWGGSGARVLCGQAVDASVVGGGRGNNGPSLEISAVTSLCKRLLWLRRSSIIAVDGICVACDETKLQNSRG